MKEENKNTTKTHARCVLIHYNVEYVSTGQLHS